MNKKDLKTPRFAIADNPMVENSGQYIVHMRDPLFYAEIHEHKDEDYQSAFHDQLMAYQKEKDASLLIGRSRDFYQSFTLVTIADIKGNQEFADKMAKIMKQMVEWHQALIIHEEKEHDEQGNTE